MAHQYHYLIAGLPELALTDKKLPAGVADFRESLDRELHPSHRALVKIWFLPFDHANVANALYRTHKPFDHRGIFSPAEIEQMVDRKRLDDEPVKHPFLYLSNTLQNALSTDETMDIQLFEAQLNTGYYHMLLSHPNAFVRQYARFDLNLRNVFAALNGRKFNVGYQNQLIGDDEVVDALIKNRARDFGLAPEIPYIDTLVQIFETENLLDRELKLDLLRWQLIDEATFFSVFSIEKVLAFLLKLMMVDRWLSLDEEKGRDLFKQWVRDLEKKHVTPDEYKITHGYNQ